jgi:hypothetical protein
MNESERKTSATGVNQRMLNRGTLLLTSWPSEPMAEITGLKKAVLEMLNSLVTDCIQCSSISAFSSNRHTAAVFPLNASFVNAST